jgi:adenylate kinase family enzyme
MVGDREVVGLLFRELLRDEYRDGVVIDGFPRTLVQVEEKESVARQLKRGRETDIRAYGGQRAQPAWAKRRRPVMKTSAPSATNRFAVAKPMPLLPP